MSGHSVAPLMVVAIIAAGCSSIMNGSHQAIPVNTTPAGAEIRLDCGNSGSAQRVTPATVELPRKTQPCLLTLTKEGYEEVKVMFARKVSGWVWGNLVFGGLVGLAIDGISGGMFQKVPEMVTVELRKVEAASTATAEADPEEDR